VSIKRTIILIAVVLLSFIAYGLWPEGHMGSRHLQCASITNDRAQVICRRLEDEMQWTWMGHAIISPGWRISFDGVAHVYCTENIGPSDFAALDVLKQRAKDWRAESGADMLLRLARGQDEPSTSLFNPSNPSFVLKDGCRRR